MTTGPDTTQSKNPPAQKANRLGLLVLIVVVGAWGSTAFHYVQGVYHARPYPLNTFLFLPHDRFMDFFNDYWRAKGFLSGSSSVISYTPFAHLVMTVFTSWRFVTSLYVASAVFLAAVVFMIWRFYVNVPGSPVQLRLLQLFILAAMTYPVLFVLDRGNQEMLVFALLFGFAYFYYVKRRPWVAVIFLAAATAMKIYPGVFIVLLIADRRYRESVVMALTTAFAWLASASVLALASHRGLLSVLTASRATLVGGQGSYMLTLDSVGHRHTLWSLVTLRAYLTGRAQALPGLIQPYGLACLTAFLLISAYVVFVEREQWKRFALLTVAMLLLPYLSASYNLIHLFLPLMLFLNTRRESRFDSVYTVLFALLLVPLDYIVIVSDVSISTLFYPVIMICLLVLIVVDRLMTGSVAHEPDALDFANA